MKVRNHFFYFCRFFILFFVIFTAMSAHAAERVQLATTSNYRGPLNISNTFPATLFFLNYRPLRAENLRKGEYRLLFDIDEANTIVVDRSPDGTGEVLLDSELTQYRLDVATGLTRRFEVGISLALLRYHGGFLDGFIEAVEGAAGRPSGKRKARPEDDFRIYLSHNNVAMLDLDGNVAGFGDTVLRGKYAILAERARHPLDLSLRCDLKIPTGNKSKGMGSGSVDAGFSALAHKSFGRFHVQGDMAYQAIGKLKLGDGFNPENVFTGVLSTEYAWDRISANLQFVYTQTALREIGILTLEEGGEAVTLGMKWDVTKNAVFQLSMTENISDVTFSDFSVNAGLEYRFGKKKAVKTRPEK